MHFLNDVITTLIPQRVNISYSNLFVLQPFYEFGKNTNQYTSITEVNDITMGEGTIKIRDNMKTFVAFIIRKTIASSCVFVTVLLEFFNPVPVRPLVTAVMSSTPDCHQRPEYVTTLRVAGRMATVYRPALVS